MSYQLEWVKMDGEYVLHKFTTNPVTRIKAAVIKGYSPHGWWGGIYEPNGVIGKQETFKTFKEARAWCVIQIRFN